MKIKTNLKDLYLFNGQKFNDNRGYLREIYKNKKINQNLIFSIISKSKKNVLRGLHIQMKKSQSKFLSVIKGKILDVAVDLRKNSKTFGKHYKIILSEKNCRSLFLPAGYAHGFLGLEKENIVLYSCNNYRDKKSEVSILWNDKELNINWGIKKPIISNKDKNALSFKMFKNKFIK